VLLADGREIPADLLVLAIGVRPNVDLARAADDKLNVAKLGRPLFLQISDTHIGFAKDANPDVNGTLAKTAELVNGMAEQPALIIHTGDITHLSKPAEFDLAQQMLGQLRVTELHTVPGEHDTADSTVTEYFQPVRQGVQQQRLLQLHGQLRRFGSVTVLNGHIHQIVQKVEGNVTFHTARSTAYPQPVAGVGAGPGPLKVPADQLPRMLGVTSVSVIGSLGALALADTTIA
jgi:predicted phosphodiesterase